MDSFGGQTRGGRGGRGNNRGNRGFGGQQYQRGNRGYGMGGGQFGGGGYQQSYHMQQPQYTEMQGGGAPRGNNYFEHRGGRGGSLQNGQHKQTNYQKPPPGNIPYQTSRFKEEDQVAVKIRGLPYQVRYEQITEFFKDHKFIEKSAILGVGADGRKNGFGSILFEDPDEAQMAAKELDGQYIGERYVEISMISYGDYLRFNGPSGGGFNSGNTVKLSKFVGPDNEERSLIMRGLPYKIQTVDIVDFFGGHGGVDDKTVFVEEFNGKRTGSALVIFDTEENAKIAKEKFHKQGIGKEGRYVELYDNKDQFMKKICNLFTEEDFE